MSTKLITRENTAELLLDKPILKHDLLINHNYAIATRECIIVSPAIWSLLDGATSEEIEHLTEYLPIEQAILKPKSYNEPELTKWLGKVLNRIKSHRHQLGRLIRE